MRLLSLEFLTAGVHRTASRLRRLRRRATLVAAAALAAMLCAPALAAQRVLGPTLDATTLRRGTLRTSLETESILLRGRWADGDAQRLGAGLGGPIDVSFPVTGLTAGPGLEIIGLGITEIIPSLGDAQVDLRQRLAITRLGVEYGLTDRITLRARAPFVRARAEGSLSLDATSANAGLNPSIFGSGVAADNRAVVDAYSGAAAALGARRDDCVNDANAHPECATILAEAAQVDAAIARATQLAGAFTVIYGADGLGTGQRFVPMAGSPLESALADIATGLRDNYDRWGAPIGVSGTGLPLGGQVPIAADELASYYTGDSPFGLETAPLRRSARQDLGDIDLGVTVKLFDAFPGDSARRAANRLGLRQSVSLTYRLGGGNFDIPDNIIDLGTGSGHDALALHSITDVVVNDNFWATVSVGWARAAGHERTLRLPVRRGVDLVSPFRLARVSITPADLFELRVAPRWQFNDYLGVGGEWRFRARGEDDVQAIDPALPITLPNVPVPYGDGAIQMPSDANEHRWAWTFTYSTVGSTARGVARLPLELHYTHEQSVGSTRGIVPRRWEDRVQIRVYTRLFGR